MNSYRIEPSGKGFKVIEVSDDGDEKTFDRFATEAAAEMWLVTHLSMKDRSELARWMRRRL